MVRGSRDVWTATWGRCSPSRAKVLGSAGAGGKEASAAPLTPAAPALPPPGAAPTRLPSQKQGRPDCSLPCAPTSRRQHTPPAPAASRTLSCPFFSAPPALLHKPPLWSLPHPPCSLPCTSAQEQSPTVSPPPYSGFSGLELKGQCRQGFHDPHPRDPSPPPTSLYAFLMSSTHAATSPVPPAPGPPSTPGHWHSLFRLWVP